jgi:hypothetical protein
MSDRQNLIGRRLPSIPLNQRVMINQVNRRLTTKSISDDSKINRIGLLSSSLINIRNEQSTVDNDDDEVIIINYQLQSVLVLRDGLRLDD